MLYIKVDTRAFNQLANKVSKAVPRVTRRALNNTAKAARKDAEKTTAAKLNLSLKWIRGRYDTTGARKGDRSRFVKATNRRLSVAIFVYMRGLPVFQIAVKVPKRKGQGVKGTKGRFYKGAFYANNKKGGKPMVLKRLNKAGPRGGKVMMPKIGIRKWLNH